ncbi:MAG: hypothetical protein AAF004_11100 [Pseudomonadota bacterium]
MKYSARLWQPLTLICFALLGACTPVTQSTAPAAQTQDMVTPAENLRDRQPPTDAQRFSIVAANSELRVLAFRDGPMARFGHNHVIRSGALSGSVWVAPNVTDSLVRMVLPVDSLMVDEEAFRAEEGEEFSAPVDDKARAGTRKNMLSDKLLNAAEHAFVRATCATSDALILTRPGTIACDIMIAGNTITVIMPLTLSIDGTQLEAIGEATVRHEQLGLTPFSAAGGAISVADGLTLRYKILAQRLSN